MKNRFLLVLLLLISFRIDAITDVQYLLRYLDEFYEPNNEFLNNSESHYDSVIYETLDRRFSVQLLPTYTFATNAFDDCGNKLTLGQSLFCECIFLEDIYLPALLSKEGLLLPDDSSMSPCEQFLTQLADVKLDFCAEEKTFVFNLAAFYRFCIHGCIDGYVGLNIPIVHQRHELEMILTGGTLLEQGDSSPSVLCQFFSQFSGTQEFIIQLFQDCKNMLFDPEQNDTGLGDIQGVIFADFGKLFSDDLRLASGLNVSFSTSKKPTGNFLWETQLGLGGANIINPFIDIQYHYNWYFRPRLFISGFFTPDFTTIRRVSRNIENTTAKRVFDTELCVPEDFDDFIVEPFKGLDSSCPILASTAPCVCVDQGDSVLLHLSNEINDVFSTDLSLDIGYVLLHQEPSSVTIVDAEDPSSYDTELATGIAQFTAHIIEWNISYNPRDYFALAFGSGHVVAGTNAFKDNRIFAQFLAYF